MLKEWKEMECPDKEELKARLSTAREKLARQQMLIKEKKIPVLVVMEGWGTAGKGHCIGQIIRNIDPRFFKVATMQKKTEEDERMPFLYRHFVKIPEEGQFVFLDTAWMDETTQDYMSGSISEELYANRIEFAGAKMVDRPPFPEDAEGFLEIPEGMEEEMPFR